MPRRALAPVALLALLAAAGLAGCSNGRVSDQDTARGTVRTFLDQCAAGRGIRVLDVLNPAARNVFLAGGDAARGCAKLLRLPPGAPPSRTQLHHAGVAVTGYDGGTARVAVRVGPSSRTLTLTDGSEGWQIEGPS